MARHFNDRVAVIGLGYVGLPLALAFARAGRAVVGFDVDHGRIADLVRGVDRNEPDRPSIALPAGLMVTAEPGDLAGCEAYVVAVATPIDGDRRPDIGPMLSADDLLGGRKGGVGGKGGVGE